ncbi:MAG: tetratricopeptide repeat protein [Nitrosopumilus sp.]|nr:tetratricopeptide repeat protein [Nitrosopumilus sp.]
MVTELECLGAALGAEPGSHFLLANKGRILHRTGDVAGAAALYDAAFAAEPRSATALMGRSVMAAEASRYAEAAGYLDRLLGILGEALEGIPARAGELRDPGRDPAGYLDGTARLMREALVARAGAMHRLGMHTEATDFERALAAGPDGAMIAVGGGHPEYGEALGIRGRLVTP